MFSLQIYIKKVCTIILYTLPQLFSRFTQSFVLVNDIFSSVYSWTGKEWLKIERGK
jgi:hypothetical protein